MPTTVTEDATREQVQTYLQTQGVHTDKTEDKGYNDGGLMCAAWKHLHLFNYGACDWDLKEETYQMGVAIHLADKLCAMGWFAEWNNNECISFWRV